MRKKLGRTDQRLGGNTTKIQTFASHFVFFNQRDFGLNGGGDIGRYQAGRTGTNDHHIAVEFLRFLIVA